MVVSVIIVIVMSLMVPRLGSTERRAFDNSVDAVADLLMMYAHRDTVGAKPVGLQYDAGRRTLLMMVLDDDGDPKQVPAWTVDPFVRPVVLPPAVAADDLLVFADGELVDLDRAPLGHAPGEKRPNIEVLMESTEGDYRVTLVLAPHAVSARRSDASDRYSARQPVDLDAAGRSREDW